MTSQVKSTSPDFIYYDLQINNFQSTNTESPHLSFLESRSIPILEKANDYTMSIVRFQIDTYSLPTFIADIMPSQADPNKMIESVTLEWDTSGTVVSTNPLFLTWIPTNKNIATPAGPSTLETKTQSNYTQYYHGNSFRHYCDLVNTALATQTTALIAQVGGGTLTGLLPPFLKWNENTHCAELHAQELYYNWSRANHVNIYFNRPLFAKFTSMPAIRYGISATLGRNYKMYMMDDMSTRTVTIGGQTYIKTPQEFSTISNWTPVAGIVFISNTLPIVSNQMSAPVVYDNNSLIKAGLTPNFNNIISDICTNEMCYKPNLIYTPSGENRRIDLKTEQALADISIQVYWRDKKGNLIPFVLLSGASASMKILFEKKKK